MNTPVTDSLVACENMARGSELMTGQRVPVGKLLELTASTLRTRALDLKLRSVV
jgi:hypothetical protein